MSEYEVAADAGGGGHSAGVVPVYPATEHLKSTKIRELVWNAREAIRHVVEPLPAWLRLAERLPDRPAAVDAVHFPDEESTSRRRARRLAFEELFLFELSLAARKRARESELRAPRRSSRAASSSIPGSRSLPFELTGDQRARVRGHRRRHRVRAADAAAADGRGRLAARPSLRCTRCCGRWRAAARRC